MPPAISLSPIPAALVALLDASGRSDADLCRESGLSPQYVSDIRHGRRWASLIQPDKLASLARVLGLTPAALGRLVYESHPEKNPA